VLGRPSLYGLPQSIPALRLGETVYRQPQPPRGLGRAAAATILATREEAEVEAEVRRSNARALLRGLAESSLVTLIGCDPLSQPGYLRLPARLPRGLGSFADVDQALSAGVAPSYPSTLGALPQLASKLHGPEESWPGAQDLARSLVTFPTHSRVSSRDVTKLIELVSKLTA
jgi:dTDP-4-amino-4,6-dideoxygalactose transaminase